MLRPLLQHTRAQLVAYAQRRGLKWHEDPSNTDTTYDRNLVRWKLVPGLRERWPDFSLRATRWAAQQRRQSTLLQQLLANRTRLQVQDLLLDTGPELLYAWLESQGAVAPSKRALAEYCRQLAAPEEKSPRLSLAGGELRRYRQQVHFVGFRPELGLPGHIDLQAPGELSLAHGQLRVAGPPGRLQVRFAARLAGSRFAPAVRRQRWQQMQIPPWDRSAYPQLFLDGQRLGMPTMVGPESGVTAARGQPLAPLAGAPADSPWRALWQPVPGMH